MSPWETFSQNRAPSSFTEHSSPNKSVTRATKCPLDRGITQWRFTSKDNTKYLFTDIRCNDTQKVSHSTGQASSQLLFSFYFLSFGHSTCFRVWSFFLYFLRGVRFRNNAIFTKQINQQKSCLSAPFYYIENLFARSFVRDHRIHISCTTFISETSWKKKKKKILHENTFLH